MGPPDWAGISFLKYSLLFTNSSAQYTLTETQYVLKNKKATRYWIKSYAIFVQDLIVW